MAETGQPNKRKKIKRRGRSGLLTLGLAQSVGGGRPGVGWIESRRGGAVQRVACGSTQGPGEVLCSLLKNAQQKQRQVHGDAEDGVGEVLATGSAGTSE